jgi:SAM-dependent methyltransferase
VRTRWVSTIATKPLSYYKGIRMKADTGLHDQIAEVIAPRLQASARVLDFGCGEGALSERLKDMGLDVLSVDIDADGFRASTAFERLDFNDHGQVGAFQRNHAEQFDLILGVEVIEHVENPWQYIRDLRTMVRPGGYILVTTPNVTSWLSRISFLRTGRLHQFGDSDREYGHINPIAEDELRLIAERTGLEVVAIAPGGWLPRLWLTGGLRTILWNIAGFVGTFRMKGMWDGWCLIALMRRPLDG